MKHAKIAAVSIQRFREGTLSEQSDAVVAEEPLEIRLNHGKGEFRKQDQISVTMRTPGNDFELALGFLFSEGIIDEFSQVKDVRYCTELKDPAEEGNVVIVDLNTDIEVDIQKLERHFYTSSSCGVCGKTSIESVGVKCNTIPPSIGPKYSVSEILGLGDKAREPQVTFRHTGGLHAATLFDGKGKLILQREDVGRHNAVDKVIGAAIHKFGAPLNNYCLHLSGRAGFELVQKAARAGIPIVTAVGAPSSLAIELAKEQGLTLIGFLKKDYFNLYSGAQRLLNDQKSS